MDSPFCISSIYSTCSVSTSSLFTLALLVKKISSLFSFCCYGCSLFSCSETDSSCSRAGLVGIFKTLSSCTESFGSVVTTSCYSTIYSSATTSFSSIVSTSGLKLTTGSGSTGSGMSKTYTSLVSASNIGIAGKAISCFF